MLSTKQLIGFLREKSKFPDLNISPKEIGVYMALFNQIPAAACFAKKLKESVDIDISVVARSAFMKNYAVVDVLERFKKMGVITDPTKRGAVIYQISFKNLEQY